MLQQIHAFIRIRSCHQISLPEGLESIQEGKHCNRIKDRFQIGHDYPDKAREFPGPSTLAASRICVEMDRIPVSHSTTVYPRFFHM